MFVGLRVASHRDASRVSTTLAEASIMAIEETVVVPYALRAAKRRSELAAGLERFLNAAKTFADISAVYVYGSFARNEVGPLSDLDVLVVMRTGLRGPARGEDLVIRALPGVAFDLKVLTPEEFEMAKSGSRFWQDVLNDARLVYAAGS